MIYHKMAINPINAQGFSPRSNEPDPGQGFTVVSVTFTTTIKVCAFVCKKYFCKNRSIIFRERGYYII